MPPEQRVTAADIAVLLGVSDFYQRDTSDKSTTAVGSQVTERKQEERSENASPLVERNEQEKGRHRLPPSEGRKEDKEVIGCGVKRGVSESASETADKKRRTGDGRHSEERQSEHEDGRAAGEGRKPDLQGSRSDQPITPSQAAGLAALRRALMMTSKS